MPLSQIQANPNNPRVITEEKFKLLVKSVKEAPWMLEARPLVVDEDNVVLGGNMRLRALTEAGYTEAHVHKLTGLTPEQKQEFVIKDNVPFGQWDWDVLANEWPTDLLNEWGMDVWDPSDEPNLDDFFETVDEPKDGKFKVVLDYTEEDYNRVVELFDNHDGSREAIVLRLLSA